MTAKTLTALSGLFTGLISASAIVAGESRDAFSALDKNGNGVLSPIEASQNIELVKNWSEIDKDGNRAVDRAEFAAFETKYHAGDAPATATPHQNDSTAEHVR